MLSGFKRPVRSFAILPNGKTLKTFSIQQQQQHVASKVRLAKLQSWIHILDNNASITTQQRRWFCLYAIAWNRLLHNSTHRILSALIRKSKNVHNFQNCCWFSYHHEHGKPIVTVTNNGKSLVIDFASDETTITSMFHAAWLWSNDPTYIHPSSGQRLRSIASYTGQTIHSVEVVPANTTLQTNQDGGEEIVVTAVKPIPPPPPGCLHPIGTVYETTYHNETTNNDYKNTWLLKVRWENKPTSLVHQEIETSSVDHRSADNVSTLGITKQSPAPPLVSFYDINWLKQCRYDQEALQQRSNATKIRSSLLGSNEQQQSHNNQLKHVPFDELFRGDNKDPNQDVLFELLDSIVEYGAALITHAPPTTSGESVSRVGQALAGGSLSHGALYGDVFHVQSIPKAHNLAYTSVPLQPHQDLAYYESMPGLQLLHCLSNHVRVGGESTLIDAMAAAEEFRRLAPAFFNTLVQCPATFIKQRDGADMVYYRPHIVVLEGDSGHEHPLQQVVVAVNWSPPFEGPLSISHDHVESYYMAYAAFSYMLDNSLDAGEVYPGLDATLVAQLRSYASKHTWERRLCPGEILIFNNRRMLHGRRGFELDVDTSNGDAGRHLVGCYTNIDETLNQYRLLLRNRPDRGKRVVRNFGNGSIGTI